MEIVVKSKNADKLRLVFEDGKPTIEVDMAEVYIDFRQALIEDRETRRLTFGNDVDSTLGEDHKVLQNYFSEKHNVELPLEAVIPIFEGIIEFGEELKKK